MIQGLLTIPVPAALAHLGRPHDPTYDEDWCECCGSRDGRYRIPSSPGVELLLHPIDDRYPEREGQAIVMWLCDDCVTDDGIEQVLRFHGFQPR